MSITTTPARPSISPLSAASKTLKSSPIATRDSTMHDVEAQLNSEMGVDNGDADADLGDGQDDGSSSLSEPDDDDADGEDEQNGVDDSGLEDGVRRAQRDLEADSEAETERLDQTPQKLRKTVDALGRTPSKLSQAATAEEDLSDPPSPIPTGAGAASSTSTVATAGQKRKRSDTAESPLTSAESDIGESPRKRTHEMLQGKPAEPEDDAEPSTETAEQAEETPLPDDAPAAPAKGGRGRKGKRKFKKPEETEAQPVAETVEVEEEVVEDNAPKTEEDLQAKKEASSIYDDVAKQFRSFREKLCNERLATITTELQLLSHPECAHPEYVKQAACVDARLQKQVREAHAYYNYKLRSVRDRTLGDRSQLHSQFYQTAREVREDVLYKLGEDWYAIQKERRNSYEENDDRYIYKFRTNKSRQVRYQAKYNQEVSILSGIAKYVGFPAAPELSGVEGNGIEEDLKAMKIPERLPAPIVQPPPAQRPVYFPAAPSVHSAAQSERLAHEQFLEQNPWARQQAPIHHSHAHGSGVGTPGISHTPDWAEPTPSARNLLRDISGQIWRNAGVGSSPLPAPARQLGASNGPDLPSGNVHAPSAADRLSLLHQLSGAAAATMPASSPLTTLPKPRDGGIGNGNVELTGFRNISNISAISGASTIDAPPELQENDPRQFAADAAPTKYPLPDLTHQSSAPQQIFETSQLHRHPMEEKREVYANPGFRPMEGEFGTPAPVAGTLLFGAPMGEGGR